MGARLTLCSTPENLSSFASCLWVAHTQYSTEVEIFTTFFIFFRKLESFSISSEFLNRGVLTWTSRRPRRIACECEWGRCDSCECLKLHVSRFEFCRNTLGEWVSMAQLRKMLKEPFTEADVSRRYAECVHFQGPYFECNVLFVSVQPTHQPSQHSATSFLLKNRRTLLSRISEHSPKFRFSAHCATSEFSNGTFVAPVALYLPKLSYLLSFSITNICTCTCVFF